LSLYRHSLSYYLFFVRSHHSFFSFFHFFFFYSSAAHLDLHSFPTRRSSDLDRVPAEGIPPPHWSHDLPAPAAGHRAHRHRRRAEDRKSTRLNSSHVSISYAVFCLKKKKKNTQQTILNKTT